jgi:hypothetical protein
MVALISHFLRFCLQFTRKNRHWLKPLGLKKKKHIKNGLNQCCFVFKKTKRFKPTWYVHNHYLLLIFQASTAGIEAVWHLSANYFPAGPETLTVPVFETPAFLGGESVGSPCNL